ncbi:MAG: hypothetical protein KGQ36_04935 [Rickettsiales bacterium]|nr:hypothetical protein [Rickettsiales bacterium]
MKNSAIKIKFPGFQIQVSKFPKKRFAANARASFRPVFKNHPKTSFLKNSKNLASLVIVDYIQVSRFPKILQKKFQVSNWLNLPASCFRGKFPSFQTSPPPLHGG